MNAYYRLAFLVCNIGLLLSLLFVRLERQHTFTQLQQVSREIHERQLLYNTTIVEYYKKMSLLPLQAKGEGYALPRRLPPWVEDTPI